NILDYRIDQFARRFCVLLDLGTLLVEYTKPLRISGLIRRRLHFRNYHLAECKTAFKRTNMRPGQISVSWDVLGVQLIKQMANGASHHHRQNGRDYHEDDQSYGDTNYFSFDRWLIHKGYPASGK